MSPPFRPLAKALESANPTSLLAWLKAGRSSALLARLIDERTEITHEALDRLPQRGDTRYIRELLVATGILPRRNEPFAQLLLWAESTISGTRAHHQKIIRPFAEWAVIRDARRRVERGSYRPGAAADDRRQIGSAITFLNWLDSISASIGAITQQHIDDYFTAFPAQRQSLGLFLKWLKDRRIGDEFELPKRQAGLPNTFQTQDEHEQQLRRFLTDGTLPLDVRVAGALISLYAIPVVRLVELTTDRLEQTEAGTYLTIERNPVLLPPTLDSLITTMNQQRRVNTLVQPSGEPAYLFPGRPATRPRHPAALRVADRTRILGSYHTPHGHDRGHR